MLKGAHFHPNCKLSLSIANTQVDTDSLLLGQSSTLHLELGYVREETEEEVRHTQKQCQHELETRFRKENEASSQPLELWGATRGVNRARIKREGEEQLGMMLGASRLRTLLTGDKFASNKSNPLNIIHPTTSSKLSIRPI